MHTSSHDDYGLPADNRYNGPKWFQFRVPYVPMYHTWEVARIELYLHLRYKQYMAPAGGCCVIAALFCLLTAACRIDRVGSASYFAA